MKLLNTFKKYTAKTSAFGVSALVSALASAAPHPPAANNITDLSDFKTKVASAFGSGASIMYIIAAIIGIVFVIAGLFKAKSHSMDMQGTQGGSKQAVVMITIGAALIAIPVIMLASSATLFGNSGQFALPQESTALNN